MRFVAEAAAVASGYSESCRCFPVTWSVVLVAPGWGRPGR